MEIKIEEIALFIIIVILSIFIIYNLYSSYKITRNEEKVIHEYCKNSCGNKSLICDVNRCKKIEGAECASDEDCSFGLYCNEWKCSVNEPEIKNVKLPKKDKKKNISWK